MPLTNFSKIKKIGKLQRRFRDSLYFFLHLLQIQIGHNTRQGVLDSAVDGTDHWQTYSTALSRGCSPLLVSFTPRTQRTLGRHNCRLDDNKIGFKRISSVLDMLIVSSGWRLWMQWWSFLRRGFFKQLRNNEQVRKLEHFIVLVWSYACKCRSWEVSYCLWPGQVQKQLHIECNT